MVPCVACFVVSLFTVCLDDINQVWVAEWPPFGKELVIRMDNFMFSLYYVN